MTPHLYVISPEGDRYNNTKKIEDKSIILNTTMDETDYKYTNRIGIVKAIPKRFGPLREGDRVIVHHNTFRKWFNVQGVLKDSSNFIKEDHFYVGTDQIFAYNRGDGWKCIEDYCFIKPIIKDLEEIILDTDKHVSKEGIVKFGNPILEEQGISEGDRIRFINKGEYAFTIDEELLWKMSAYRDVKLKINGDKQQN